MIDHEDLNQTDRLRQLAEVGVSIWLDDLSRERMADSGGRRNDG